MLKTESCGIDAWGRVCDTCRSAACAVYCRADSAYLCTACDVRIHRANPVATGHERVWVCEACERAPAAFVCKADAASLCASCDADIHEANPLARRHHRVPILPISGDLYGPQTAEKGAAEENEDEEDDGEAASWLLLSQNPDKNKDNNNHNTNNNHQNNENENGFLSGGEVDEYLDFMEYNNNNSCGENQFGNRNNFNQEQMSYSVNDHKNYGGDSVVPVQHQRSYQLGMEYDSFKAGYSYPASISQSVSISSLEVGVVPESTISDISISHTRPPKGTIDLFSGPAIPVPTQLTPMDREARVLRYREKKKMRKFEKTIRYASRKAYAETRPRIKGRFAKRTEVEVEVDQMFSTSLMADAGYGIVPSF